MEVPYYTGPSQVYMNEPASKAIFNAVICLISMQLDYHLYTPTIPSAFVTSSTANHFVPPSSELRQLLQERSHTIRSVPFPGVFTFSRTLRVRTAATLQRLQPPGRTSRVPYVHTNRQCQRLRAEKVLQLELCGLSGDQLDRWSSLRVTKN